MLPQFFVSDLIENRKINLIGQQQIVQFLGNGAEFRRSQGIAIQGKVDVRAGLVITLGAGAVQNRFLDGGKAGEYGVDFLHRLRRQTMLHGLRSGSR